MISSVPSDLILLKQLKKLNLSNNKLTIPVKSDGVTVEMDLNDSNESDSVELSKIPDCWVDVWGDYDATSGKLVNENGPVVMLGGNIMA